MTIQDDDDLCAPDGTWDGGTDDEEPLEDRGPMHEASEESFDKWAKLYDDLNGAPESGEDR